MTREAKLESREPRYFQIKRDLLARLDSGRLKPGDQLPTEQELQDEFEVSRGTVRRALDELAFEGRIERQPGRGTFVPGHPPRVQTHKVRSFTEQVKDRKQVPSTQIVSAEEVPAARAEAAVRTTFALALDDPVIRIQRLRLGGGHPLSLQTVYLLPAQVPGILGRALHQLMPLYESYGKQISYGEERIRVRYIDAEEAQLLDIEPGEPIIERFRVSFLKNGQPFEVLYSWDRVDTFELWHWVVS
jgi:GntR family transcriptional regulator